MELPGTMALKKAVENGAGRRADTGARFADHLRSCGATFVAMMQAAHLWEHDNLACRGWLYAARLRTILVEREMRSGPVMILKIPRLRKAEPYDASRSRSR